MNKPTYTISVRIFWANLRIPRINSSMNVSTSFQKYKTMAPSIATITQNPALESPLLLIKN